MGRDYQPALGTLGGRPPTTESGCGAEVNVQFAFKFIRGVLRSFGGHHCTDDFYGQLGYGAFNMDWHILREASVQQGGHRGWFISKIIIYNSLLNTSCPPQLLRFSSSWGDCAISGLSRAISDEERGVIPRTRLEDISYRDGSVARSWNPE